MQNTMDQRGYPFSTRIFRQLVPGKPLPFRLHLGLALGLFLGFSTHHSLANIQRREAPFGPDEFYSVNDIIHSHVTGLDFEPTKTQEEVKSEISWFILNQAKLSQKPQKDSAPNLSIQECRKSEIRKALCELMKNDDSTDTSNADSHGLLSLLRSAHRKLELNSSIRNLRLDRLSSAPPEEVRRALSKQTDLALLHAMAKKIQAAGACSHPALTQILAFRMEELLSKEMPLSSAIDLYKQASQCPEGGEFSLRAKYRLALLSFWQGRTSQSLAVLSDLSKLDSRPDYQVRALYWKARCELALKRPEEAAASQKLLQTKYPFSLHSLLVTPNPSSTGARPSLPKDTGIQFRSFDSPKINILIRIAEGFSQKGERKLALKVLEAVEPLLEEAEPELKLYTSILHARLSNHIKNFQLLAGLFRDDQTLISKSTLELFYPMGSLSQSSLSQPHSTLILSLIRQESAFNNRAQSPVGALGLMQLMPKTAKRFEKIKSREQLFDPKTNIRVGTKYFLTLLSRYSNNAELALAAYNAGPKKVDQWVSTYVTEDKLLFIDLIPYKETREYVASIARNYFWYQALYPNLTNKGPVPKSHVGPFFSMLASEPKMNFD